LTVLAPADVGWDLTVYARAWLDERAKVALEAAARVAEEPGRGPVHDVRVACRRLREAIAFFHDLAELPPLTDVDRAARRMARVVRRLRETDVAIKRLSALDLRLVSANGRTGPASPVATPNGRLATELGRRRNELAQAKHSSIEKRARQLRQVVRVALPRHRSLADHWRDTGQEQAFQAFVEARVAARRAEVESLFAAARSRKSTAALARATDELHGVRVAVKHWRYASEIARPAIPRVLYRPMAVELRRLQDLGGASQDFADLARVVEHELDRGHRSREDAVLLKAVRAAREDAARAFAQALSATFPGTRPSRSRTVGQMSG
jgi:CHAD domain-containing protein